MDMKDYFAKPDQRIEEHVEKLLYVAEKLNEYGYMDKEIYSLVKKACLHHDDGKVNEEFQKRVRSEKKLRFNREIEVPHNVLSGFMLNREEFHSEEDYYRVLFAIMYHHDYGNPYEIAREEKGLIQNLLKEFTIYSLSRKQLNMMQRMIQDNIAIKIKGYLHKCDYSASGNYIAEYPSNFLEEALENVKMKWKKSNPNSDWNDLQKFCMSKRNKNIIVVAQTGMGKTEAGLQWIGNHKGYFVLPLRTAINAIYNRVRDDVLLGENIDTRLSILHSESLEYYSKNLSEEMDIVEYENRGKRFSIPLNISTMDQLFDFVFKYQGYELNLTTFSYSKIVIDEIQMYDPELLAYLIIGLKRITELGGNVAIMTATLSPFIKELLMREISFEEENIQTFITDAIRHNVKVKNSKIQAEDIFELYDRNRKIGKPNKVLVVCNSIKKAQELYGQLEQKLEKTEELHILHSRFIKEERAKLEKEILAFGQNENERMGIWISTSLVEASLDIDFDYLFTELQDLNSLLQRFGRCNRKGKKNVSDYNCFVYLEIDEGMLNGKNSTIDKTIFNISQKAMRTIDGPLSEKQKLELLDTYLTMENLKKSDYYMKYKDTIEWMRGLEAYKYEKNENQLRNIMTQDIIPSPIYEEHKETIENLAKELEENHCDVLKQIKAKEEIMKYTVSIQYYQWLEYKKEVKNNRAESYPEISMGRYGTIPVMECYYDKLGYRKLDYKTVICHAEFF